MLIFLLRIFFKYVINVYYHWKFILSVYGTEIVYSMYRLGYRVDCLGWNLGRGKRFFCFRVPRLAQCPPRLRLSSQEVKQTEVNHFPPSSAEVKNDWNFTSILPVCLHGMYTAPLPSQCVPLGYSCILFIILFLVLQEFHNFLYGVELCVLQRPCYETLPEIVY